MIVAVIASLTAVEVGLKEGLRWVKFLLVQDAFPMGDALTAAGQGRLSTCILIDRCVDVTEILDLLAMRNSRAFCVASSNCCLKNSNNGEKIYT